METNITKINVGGTLLPVNDPNVCDNFEDGNTASKTYNAGEFLIWKGSLYKVTTTIAQGATFTDGVNLEETTIVELLEAVNNVLADMETAYNRATLLKQNVSGVINFDKSLYDYALLRFENSNFGIRDVHLYDGQQNIRLDTVSMSGSICVICLESWTISNDGKTLTPDYKVQINIESTGVTLFDTSATFTWNILGLEQIESI